MPAKYVQKPDLSAFGDIVCLFVCLFVFTVVDVLQQCNSIVKFRRKEEMLPQNDW